MKLAQFFGKNQLDEMQERTMLTIESRGFWLVWSLLLVVLLGEGLLGFTMQSYCWRCGWRVRLYQNVSL